jgi:hypothetical protein
MTWHRIFSVEKVLFDGCCMLLDYEVWMSWRMSVFEVS